MIGLFPPGSRPGTGWRHGRSRCHSDLLRQLWTSVLLGLLATPGVGSADQHDRTFFAEPVSGRKVSHYTIQLPVGRDRVQSFRIPDDCAKVVRTLDSGMAHKGRIVARRLWHKVESDCHFHSFLDRHPQPVVQDFVSDYDFMNARLHDLPIDMRCIGDGIGGSAACDPTATDGFGLLRHFPLAEPLARAEPGEPCACEFIDGVFHGHLYVDPDGVHCFISDKAPTLRLIAVDFTDVNGDRILDALLRLVPIGPGVDRRPLILPLTRLEPSAPFTVPQAGPAALPPQPPQRPLPAPE